LGNGWIVPLLAGAEPGADASRSQRGSSSLSHPWQPPYRKLAWTSRRPSPTPVPNPSTHVRQPVTVDGSNSFDAAADSGGTQPGLLSFRWSIVGAPAGSRAWIDTTSPAPVLVPDVAGAYVLQLYVIAADGRVSAAAQTTVTAYDGNAAPVALADAVRTVAVHSAGRAGWLWQLRS
jgi:hypothetical protein